MNGDEDIKKCVDLPIDYDEVYKNLGVIREKSYDYLRESLKG